MSASIDTTQTYVIVHSRGKLLALLAGAIGFTALCIFLATKMGNSNDPRVVVIYAGIVFFGAGAVTLLYRLMQSGPVVTISPEGITDIRVAARMIPWSAVRAISTWSYKGQNVMVLAVDPAIEPELELTRMARWSRKANKSFGIDGLCVAASGLATPYDWMLRTSMAYAAAAQGQSATTIEHCQKG